MQMSSPTHTLLRWWHKEKLSCRACDYLGTALFWAITQRVVVIPYGCFWATFRSYLKRSRIQEFLSLEYRTDKLSQNVGNELPLHAM